jgi:hypothetical protein
LSAGHTGSEDEACCREDRGTHVVVCGSNNSNLGGEWFVFVMWTGCVLCMVSVELKLKPDGEGLLIFFLG